ncbi:ionotropic receptor 25a [Nephila pilipes]|uniref:Ionotropic receptor 25a n=1 Tax=Nephila pilipes TaxID=299642 RepID=A0A8X6UGD3_NEPPI|nr:ionotropic receptor 25a [Nephila pilipes]
METIPIWRILKLLNQRKLEGLKEKWWNKNPAKKECDDSSQQSDGISIANIGGVFIVIFIGVVLAVLTLIIEYFLYKKKRRSHARVVSVDRYPKDRHATDKHINDRHLNHRHRRR